MEFRYVIKFLDILLCDMENDLAILHICGQFTGVTDIQSRHCLVRLHIPQPCVERIRHVEVLGRRSLHHDNEMPCGVGLAVNRDRLRLIHALGDLPLRHLHFI